jgi:hypothetical protein
MREACALVFERWIEAGTRRFVDAGLGDERSRELTIAMLAALEGAFVLARASRSTDPLRIAGEAVASEVARALEERAPPAPPRKPRLKARWPAPPA